MFLLFLGLAFILIGTIIFTIQNNFIRRLQTTIAMVIGYEQGEKGDGFYPVATFEDKKNKYVFKNANPIESPLLPIGSYQNVYFETSFPLKATLTCGGRNYYAPRLLLFSGVFFFWLFFHLNGFYFFIYIFLILIRPLYKKAHENYFFANTYKEYISDDHNIYKLNEVQFEDKKNTYKLIDRATIKIYRERWLKKRQELGLLLLVAGALCFFNLRTIPELRYESTTPSHFCKGVESVSCFFTVSTQSPEETHQTFIRFVDVFLGGAGVVLVALALMCFFSRRLFIREDVFLGAS